VTEPTNDNATPAQTAEEKVVSPTPPPSTQPTTDQAEVDAALSRKTQDGKGSEEVPESDFESFATENVENTGPSAKDLAQEVLEGRWGYNRRAALRNLREQGHNSDDVDEQLQLLLDSGAPSTLVG
jgi:hypothetical protein